MKRPATKPAGSTWIYFAPTGLPPATWLVHKLSNGVVDLSLGGAGERIGELRDVLRPVLANGMVAERTGKSSSIRIAVPAINISRDFAEQREKVLSGMRGARRLLAWAREQRTTLSRFVRDSDDGPA
jgi:hypothetical protein